MTAAATLKVSSWMPLYVGDYLADTTHLSTAEHGAYLLLIMTYWRTEAPIEDDDERLARIVGATPKEWAKLRKPVAAFFDVADGVWRHKRIDAELAAARDRRIKAKERSERANEVKASRSAAETRQGRAEGAGAASFEVTSKVTSKGTDKDISSPSPSPVDSSERYPPGLSGGAPLSASPPAQAGPGDADRRRATRLPDDWPLTDELMAIAERARADARLPPIDVALEHAKFADYWRARSGAKATSLDWCATWRNWIRRSNPEEGHGRQSRGAQRAPVDLEAQRRADRLAILEGCGIAVAGPGGADLAGDGVGDRADAAGAARLVGSGRA